MYFQRIGIYDKIPLLMNSGRIFPLLFPAAPEGGDKEKQTVIVVVSK